MSEIPIRIDNASANTYRIANVTDDEAISIQPLAEESLKNGRQWVVRDSFTIGTSDTLEIFFGVPSSASDSMRVVSRTVEPDSAIEGEVTYNRDGYGTGSELSFINSEINGSIDEGFIGTIESGGNYTNPSQRDGSTVSLPVRSALGVDPNGPAQPDTRPPNSSIYRISPGGSIHYNINSTADNNTITFEFIISQKEEYS